MSYSCRAATYEYLILFPVKLSSNTFNSCHDPHHPSRRLDVGRALHALSYDLAKMESIKEGLAPSYTLSPPIMFEWHHTYGRCLWLHYVRHLQWWYSASLRCCVMHALPWTTSSTNATASYNKQSAPSSFWETSWTNVRIWLTYDTFSWILQAHARRTYVRSELQGKWLRPSTITFWFLKYLRLQLLSHCT